VLLAVQKPTSKGIRGVDKPTIAQAHTGFINFAAFVGTSFYNSAHLLHSKRYQKVRRIAKGKHY